MPAKPVLLAKLTRPRLFNIVPRERLYRVLDKACKHPVIWVSGPPGSGKTALISSYLASKKAPGIWYQVDSGDGDAANFFHYMSLAAVHAAPRKRAALPLLKPEYMVDLAGFTRRYFRDLFGRLPHGSVLVLDDFHDIPIDSVLIGLMVTAFSEIPDGVNIIVISRAEAPNAFSRMIAARHLTALGWDELRLTLTESRQLLESERPMASADVQLLHQQANGWAAGLVLMLERHDQNMSASPLSIEDTNQAVFDYFAGEIIDKMPKDEHQVLLCTAYLPEISPAIAQKLSSYEAAASVLSKLHSHHLFIEKRSERLVIYRYHDLFRTFLQRRAREWFTASQLLKLFADTASSLESEGKPELAITLYCDAGQWSEASRLIHEHASILIAQARGQTVLNWIIMLPSVLVDNDAWLTYWLGTAKASIHPVSGRPFLQLAYELFARQQNNIGRALSAAALAETYFYEWVHFEPLDPLIDILVECIESGWQLSPENEMRVQSCLVAALICRQPHHPLLPNCVAQVLQKIEGNLPLEQRFNAARNLLHYFEWTADFQGAHKIITLFHSTVSTLQSYPLTRLWGWEAIAHRAFQMGDFSESYAALQEARGIATNEGLGYALPIIDLFTICVALGMGDLKGAEQLIPTVEKALNPKRHNQIGFFMVLKIWLALQRNNLPAAVAISNAFAAPTRNIGAVFFELWAYTSIAQVWVLNGDQEKAFEYLELSHRTNALLKNDLFQFQCLLTEAYAHLQNRDRESCHRQLKAGFQLGRERNFVNMSQWVPAIVSAGCAEALAAGIEVEYVKNLIMQRGLLAPTTACSDWPWPIRIFTLGRFQVLKDNVPLAFIRKSQQKPLEMLRVLIALGAAGTNANEIARILWPDADEEQFKASFDTTLHRLRKLLGYDKAVALSNGILSLNAECCWLDVWAFDELSAQIQKADGDSQKRLQLETDLTESLRLYRGYFLNGDELLPWFAPLRARLHNRFKKHVLHLGKYFETASLWADAEEVYQRGLELDHIGEEFYRRLMICHEQRGERATALEVYRRCRDMLSIVLSIPPSAETQAIYRKLLEA